MTFTPVPARATACGLPPPSLLTSSDALRGPVPDGVKVTLIEQLEPAPSVEPHVAVFEKSDAFAPVIAICQMCMVVLLELFSITGCGALLVFTT